MIVSKGDFIFGTRSNAVIISTAAQKTTATTAPLQTLTPDGTAFEGVAIWGSDNLTPQRMAKDIERTGVLSAAVDAKARIAIGKGPIPMRIAAITKDGYEELEYVNDPEISDWLDMNMAFENSYATSKDLYGWGNNWQQLLLNKTRDKIVGFSRHDPVECRFSEMDKKTRRSEYVYVCSDWAQYNNYSKDSDYIERIPLLDKRYPLLDLQGRTSGYRFMVSLQYPLHGRKYYALAPWWAAREWVSIAQSIPEMKKAMFDNQMTIKYVVTIHEKFWEKLDPKYNTYAAAKKKEVQELFYDAIDSYLVGDRNAYKSIFSHAFIDPATGKTIDGLTITALDDKIREGKLLPDSAAANSEILFAMNITPALMGADAPGGPYSGGSGSGSNIREGFLVQVMLNEAERRMNSLVFNIAKNYNGWDKSIVLRYPNQILTTLNTGKNTQPTA